MCVSATPNQGIIYSKEIKTFAKEPISEDIAGAKVDARAVP